MRASKNGQRRWVAGTVSAVWWVAAAALSQTTPPAAAPQAGVAQVVARPGAPAPVAGATPATPAQSGPRAPQPVSRPAAQSLPPVAPTQAPAAGTAVPSNAARRPAARVVTPAVSTTTIVTPVFQPTVVPVSRAAVVVVPVISTVPQAVAVPSSARSTTLSRRTTNAASAKPAAAIAVQAGPATAPTPAAPDPPPPYPLVSRAPLPEPTDPGTGGNPNAIAIPVPAPVPARRTMLQKLVPASPNIADNSLNSYVERLRKQTSSVQPTPGAIWAESGRLTRLNTDVRAMRPNDLIQVVVLENLAASTDGTVKNQRASAANSSVSSLIGALHAGNALQNLVNQTSANSLNATGASATNSSLTTTFGGQVIEVLPNGMLVIEAARQVEFSQQTQTIILRGLVRPEDISQENQVKSTAISSLELEVKGKGIVNDYTRRQNALVRLLQQILIF